MTPMTNPLDGNGVAAWPPRDWQCPECSYRSYCTFDADKGGPGSDLRCLNCKAVFRAPPAPSHTAVEPVAELVERLRERIASPLDRPALDESLHDEAATHIATLEADRAADKARIEELERERDEARAANEHDRTVIIDAHNAISDAITRRSWLMEGRGSYEWDDDRYREEFAEALKEIGAPLTILNKLGVDWSHCPTIDGDIKAARIDWKTRAEAAESEVATLKARIAELEAGLEDVFRLNDECSGAEPSVSVLMRAIDQLRARRLTHQEKNNGR